jgi:hypothetical protein
MSAATWTGYCTGCDRDGVEVASRARHHERVLCDRCAAQKRVTAPRATPSSTSTRSSQDFGGGSPRSANTNDSVPLDEVRCSSSDSASDSPSPSPSSSLSFADRRVDLRKRLGHDEEDDEGPIAEVLLEQHEDGDRNAVPWPGKKLTPRARRNVRTVYSGSSLCGACGRAPPTRHPAS